MTVPAQPLSQSQLDELRQDLIDLEQSLGRQLVLAKDSAKTVSLDEPIGRLSRMDAMQQQKVAQAGRDAARVRLQQVTAALQRCEESVYGLCAQCEDDTGYGRLKARPEARLCISCQNQVERPE